MIPKVFHRVWLDEPIPQRFEGYWRRLQKLHPEWEFVTWSKSADLGWMRNRAIFKDANTEAGRADVARYEILAKHGGVYLDTDVEPLKAFGPLIGSEPFIAWENDNVLCPTVIGSPAGHPAVKALLAGLPKWYAAHKDKTPNVSTGPHFITETWRTRSDVRRLPPIYFYPVGWWEKELLGMDYPPESYAVHHWAGGWCTAEDKPGPPATTVTVIVSAPEPLPSLKKLWAGLLPDAQILFASGASRAEAVNAAALRAKGDVLVITDAWTTAETVMPAIELAASSGRLVVPWNATCRLDPAATCQLWATGKTPEATPRRVSVGGRPASDLVVIRRDAFAAINGIDPRFSRERRTAEALRRCADTILGKTRYLNGAIWRLSLPSQPTPTALSSRKEDELRKRYVRAYRKPEAMEQLVSEHPMRKGNR